MSYKFNTDKLNIMKFLESLLKYLITVFIFIFFFTSLIQTASFLQITVKGSYDISGTDGGQTSGIVYLTTLGRNDEDFGQGEEDNWAEISDSIHNNTFEEMEEGPYHCELSLANRNCWHKYAWEGNDEWESRMLVHKEKITNLAKIGHTDVFEPSATASSQNNFYTGFKLNADLKSSIGSKFKEHMERNSRGGFGLFLVAVPYTGHFIQKIEISNIGDTSGSFIEFTSPNNSPACTNKECKLDFDNDFTHKVCRRSDKSDYHQGWINFEDGNYCHSSSRKSDAQPVTVTDIPENQRGTIFFNHYMPAYSISENSLFIGRECVGCLYSGGEGDKVEQNLWNTVWGKMNEFQPGLTTALKGAATSDTNAHKAQARAFRSNGQTISLNPKMNSNYTLTDTYLRREQPVVIGFMSDYDGGDLWLSDGSIVYSFGDYEYQIRVLFAENGYNINSEIWKPTLIKPGVNPNGSTTKNDQVLSVMSWDQTPKTLNNDVPNLGAFDTSTITLGKGGSDDCIYRATYTQWKTDEGIKKYVDNSGDMSDTSPTHFDVIGGTASTPFLPLGTTLQTGAFQGMNIDFIVKTFPPNFYVKSQDLGAYGDISQGHVLAPGWNLMENNRPIIEQNRLGSAPNEITTCGFVNSYQQVHISPNKDDFYYFHDITSVNADIYVRDIMSGSNSMNYEKLTTSNITHIKYGLNPFYVYAKIKPQTSSPTDAELLTYANNQENAEVNITFKKFPTIELKSLIGSDLLSRVTPNRVQTIEDRDPEDCTKNLIFSDNFPLFSIQPQSPVASNECASVLFKINKKLERIYIQMNDQGLITPIQIFSDASTAAKAKEGISPDPGNVDIQPLPSSLTPTQTSTSRVLSDQSRNLTLEKLSNPEEYQLTLPAVGQNIEIYIDFIPFSIYYFAATNNADAPGTIISTSESQFSGFLDGDATSEEIISDAMDDGGNGDRMIKATNNEIKNTNVNITGDGRLTYYISDILEERKPDGDPTEITSRLGDYFAKLSTYLFGALQAPDFFSSRPVVSDTNIFFILSEYKNIEVKFLDQGTDLGQVTMWMDGLVAPYNNDGVTSIMLTSNGTKTDSHRFSSNNDYTQFKPNKIKYMNGSTISDGYVAFRMWDTPTITVQPNPGFYIKEATVEYEEPPGTWTQLMELRNLPETPDALGARDILIDGVTKNIRIIIDFEEKPSIKAYWLGTDF